MAHFNGVNCTLQHEWNCSTDTVDHQFQGLGGMGITPHAAATPGTSETPDSTKSGSGLDLKSTESQRVLGVL